MLQILIGARATAKKCKRLVIEVELRQIGIHLPVTATGDLFPRVQVDATGRKLKIFLENHPSELDIVPQISKEGSLRAAMRKAFPDNTEIFGFYTRYFKNRNRIATYCSVSDSIIKDLKIHKSSWE